MQKLLLLSAVALVGLVCGEPLFKIFYTNDFHGYLEENYDHSAGADHIAWLITQQRKAGTTPFLLLDAGDLWFGAPPISQLVNGSSTNEVWNKIGYQVCAVGNHDYDKGQLILSQRIAESKCQWLSANTQLADQDWVQPSWVKPYAIRQIAGVKVGIIGLTTDETPYITVSKNVVGLQFRDPVDAVLHYYDEVRKQTDVMIILAHIGFSGSRIASQQYKGAVDVVKALNAAHKTVPVFIAAHDHFFVQPPQVVGDTMITETGCHGKHLGFVSVSKAPAGGFSFAIDQIDVNSQTAQVDPDVQQIVAKWQAVVKPLVEIVLGALSVDLVRDYFSENMMGDLVVDSMPWAMNNPIPPSVDTHGRIKQATVGAMTPVVTRDHLKATPIRVAFNNPGGLRSDLLSHGKTVNLTWGDTFEVLPFQNTLWTCSMTGEQILSVLGKSAALSKGYLSCAGIKYEFWNSQRSDANASGVQNVYVEDKPLVLSARYNVVVNSFLANGGDGFTEFSQAKDLQDTGILDQDALNAYIISSLSRHVSASSIQMGRATKITPP